MKNIYIFDILFKLLYIINYNNLLLLLKIMFFNILYKFNALRIIYCYI